MICTRSTPIEFADCKAESVPIGSAPCKRTPRLSPYSVSVAFVGTGSAPGGNRSDWWTYSVGGAAPPEDQISRVTPDQEIHVVGDRRSFGLSLAVSGQILIVGDASADGIGAAFAYRRRSSGRWRRVQKLVAPNRQTNDQYGSQVAIEGDTVVVGEWLDDDKGNDAGAVFIYRRGKNGEYVQRQKLWAVDAHANGYFGITLALSAQVLAIGARAKGDGIRRVVHLYTRGSDRIWRLVQQVLPDPDSLKQYGLSLAVCDDIIVAGMNHADDRGEDSGAAYAIARMGTDRWRVVQKFLPEDLGVRHHFGTGVDTDCRRIVVSSTAAGRGGVYIYEQVQGASWRFTDKIMSPVSGPSESFGFPAVVRGDALLVGALGHSNVGAAHLYHRTGFQVQENHLTEERDPFK